MIIVNPELSNLIFLTKLFGNIPGINILQFDLKILKNLINLSVC